MMAAIQLTAAQRRSINRLAEAVDKVTQADRAFFERFPVRKHRVRLASLAEIEQQAILSGDDQLLPDAFAHFVAVKNIAPGMRLRQHVIGLARSETDLDEAAAKAIFDSIVTPRMREIEASMLRAAEARA